MRYYISSDLSLSMLSKRALKLFNFLQAKANSKTLASFWAVPTMAREMGLSERTVQRASQELVRKGFVEVLPRYDEKGRQQSNIYKIVVPRELPHEVNSYTDDVDQLKGRELQVYMYIRRKCGCRGYRVSRREIAAELNISRSTVTGITRKLAAGGWIKKEYASSPKTGGQGWNQYAVSSIRVSLKQRLILAHLLVRSILRKKEMTACSLMSRLTNSVTPLTEFKCLREYMLNKGKIKVRDLLKAFCKRVKNLRIMVESRTGFGKVRAFLAERKRRRVGSPEKLPGAPPFSTLSSNVSAPGRVRKILEMLRCIRYHKTTRIKREEEQEWRV